MGRAWQTRGRDVSRWGGGGGALLWGGLVCRTLVRASHLCHYQLSSEISVVGQKINCSLTPAISLWRRGDNYPPLWSRRPGLTFRSMGCIRPMKTSSLLPPGV